MVSGNPSSVKLRHIAQRAPESGRINKRRVPRYVALRLLAIRPRSIGELAKRLEEKGFSSAVVQDVVRTLREEGLLDDARFATGLAETTLERKPVGRKFLAWKLQKASVPPDVAETALQSLFPPGREISLARAAAARKHTELLRRRRGTSASELRIRLGRFLLSRGFPPDVVSTVLDDLPRT